MSRLHNFLHDEEINPFLDDTLPIFVDELNGNFFILAIEWLGTILLSAHYIL